MPEKITFDSFRAALVKGIEERGGDWVYPQDKEDPEWYTTTPSGDAACRYAHNDGTPACIIGYALHELGYEISPNNTKGAYAVVGDALGFSGDKRYSGITPEAKNICSAASNLQGAQDEGVPWGEALAYFDNPNKNMYEYIEEKDF